VIEARCCRLGLSIIDAAGGVEDPSASRIAATVVVEAFASSDGYAARDILVHPACTAVLTSQQADGLAHAQRASGLGVGAIPPESFSTLVGALTTSRAVLMARFACARAHRASRKT
jgi:hypothetical protein